MTFYKGALMGACMLLGGCATGPTVLNYAPSSTMTVKGAEKVGVFDYAPARNGKVKPNQIRNTAMGNIIVEKPIADYFGKALFTESRFVGIDVSGAAPVVHGTIDEFLIDDLGYSVDWTLNVSYVVDVPGADKPCFQGQKKLARHTSKFTNAFGTLNEVMKDNIELLFKDPGFTACIAPGNVAANAPADRMIARGTVVTPSAPAAMGASPAAGTAPAAAPPQDNEGFVNFPTHQP